MTTIADKMGGFRPLTAYIDNKVGIVGQLQACRNQDGWATGTGTFQAITKHTPMAGWASYGVLSKVGALGTHAVGLVAQAVVWAPVGLVMGVYGCLLGAVGRGDASRDVFCKWYLPAYTVLGAVEIAANVTGICLLGWWVGSLFRA